MRNKDLSGTVFLVLKKQSQADDARGAKGSSAVGEVGESVHRRDGCLSGVHLCLCVRRGISDVVSTSWVVVPFDFSYLFFLFL